MNLRRFWTWLSIDATYVNLFLAWFISGTDVVKSWLPQKFAVPIIITMIWVTRFGTVLAVVAFRQREKYKRIALQEKLIVTYLRRLSAVLGNGYRVNVMVLGKDRYLRIRWHRGRFSASELKLAWSAGGKDGLIEGCCGLAVSDGGPVSGDWTPYKAAQFKEFRRPDGSTPWGINEKQLPAIRNVGSVLAMPLPGPKNPAKAVGCLNVDSKLPLSGSGLDQERVMDLCMPYAAPLGILVSSVRRFERDAEKDR